MNLIEFGDCRETMLRWVEQGIKAQMCVTSPPYFGLRDYGHEGQIGLEQTPERYIATMVDVFRCVRDVLADDGTLWLNIGDSYASSGKQQMGRRDERPEYLEKRAVRFNTGREKALSGGNLESYRAVDFGVKPKDLIGIPWMLAFALRADGWYLRQDIIWHKPNPMPESVRDRCTKAHEYVFLLSKSPRYYFDGEAMKEPAVSEKGRGAIGRGGQGSAKAVGCNGRQPQQDHSGWLGGDGETRNRRSVWTVATKPYNGKKALTDYVGDDGKPYTASPDCPIHGHLARRQTSGTHGYGGQQGQSQTGSAGTCAHHAQSPACGEQSTTSRSSQASGAGNSRQHTPESSHENKTDSRLSGHTSGDGNQSCSGCKSASGEHQDCGKDCSHQSSSSTATSHNTGTSKTARAPATIRPCMPCAETDNRTQSTSDQRGLFEQDHGISESSILTGETSVHPSQDTRICNAGTSSELVSMAYEVGEKCTCNEVIIDHFATFPPALIEPCILAGSRPGDIVLDPFMGSGTTAAVAIEHGRQYLGCELNPEYGALQQERIALSLEKCSDSGQPDLFEEAA